MILNEKSCVDQKIFGMTNIEFRWNYPDKFSTLQNYLPSNRKNIVWYLKSILHVYICYICIDYTKRFVFWYYENNIPVLIR